MGITHLVVCITAFNLCVVSYNINCDGCYSSVFSVRVSIGYVYCIRSCVIPVVGIHTPTKVFSSVLVIFYRITIRVNCTIYKFTHTFRSAFIDSITMSIYLNSLFGHMDSDSRFYALKGIWIKISNLYFMVANFVPPFGMLIDSPAEPIQVIWLFSSRIMPVFQPIPYWFRITHGGSDILTFDIYQIGLFIVNPLDWPTVQITILLISKVSLLNVELVKNIIMNPIVDFINTCSCFNKGYELFRKPQLLFWRVIWHTINMFAFT